MGFVEGETGYCSETCVTCGVDGTEEVSIEVEVAMEVKEEFSIKVEDTVDTKEGVSIKFEAVYIKEEIPETTACPPIETEHEVRLLLLVHLLLQKGKCEITLNYFLLNYIVCAIYLLQFGFQS
jgi:hypothetical protein